MQEQIAKLGSTVKLILIIAAAILVVVIAWHVVAFVTFLAFKVVELAVLVAVIYAAFLLARSALHRRTPAA